MFAPDPATAGQPTGTGRLGSVGSYAVATAVTAFAILSQYFVPELVPATRGLYRSFFGSLFVVYGIPILAFALLVGGRPLARWYRGGARGAALAYGAYGALSFLALAISVAVVIVYTAFDPSALQQLNQPNPVIQSAASNPWFWVAFSFVVGAVEEVIFRGWIFGYWLARGSRSTGWHAVWTSLLFAGVHIYYGTTYGVAAPVIYPELFLLGLAFALAVRATGGNLVWVALLHGANDATAFLTIVNSAVATDLHFAILLLGGLVALLLVVRGSSVRSAAPPAPFAPGPAFPYPNYGAPPFAVTVRPPPPPPPPPPGGFPPPGPPPPYPP